MTSSPPPSLFLDARKVAILAFILARGGRVAERPRVNGTRVRTATMNAFVRHGYLDDNGTAWTVSARGLAAVPVEQTASLPDGATP